MRGRRRNNALGKGGHDEARGQDRKRHERKNLHSGTNKYAGYLICVRCLQSGDFLVDITLYLIGLLVPFCLTLLAVLVPAKKAGGILLAGMSAVGGLVGVYFFLGVGSDGSLTQYSGTTLVYLASATLNQFTWNFVPYLPLALGFMSFMAAMYRVVEA